MIRGVGEAGVIVNPDRITREAPGGPPKLSQTPTATAVTLPVRNPSFVVADRLGGCTSEVTSRVLEIRGLSGTLQVCLRGLCFSEQVCGQTAGKEGALEEGRVAGPPGERRGLPALLSL